MTNKMKIALALVLIALTVVSIMFSTETAIDAAQRVLSTVATAVGMHGMPAHFMLAILVISFLGLWLSFRKERHS